MDNSNLAGKKYPNSQCVHGRCLNHGPEWENVSEKRYEPNPGVFGKEIYWTLRCCGKLMARRKVVQTQRCRKCGRMENNTVVDELALCLCCGYHFDGTPSST